jgi:thioredoxin reductase (NADPH)
MPLPVLLVIDEDPVVLEDIASQLGQRYAHDYRVETLSDPEPALRLLGELASAGAEVALVLAGKSLLDASSGELFDRVRQLHPHAKRALVVPAAAWADQPSS